MSVFTRRPKRFNRGAVHTPAGQSPGLRTIRATTYDGCVAVNRQSLQCHEVFLASSHNDHGRLFPLCIINDRSQQARSPRCLTVY